MSEKTVFRCFGTAVVALSLGAGFAPGFRLIGGPAQQPSLTEWPEGKLIRISEIASVKAKPDTAYVLMTVNTERGLLADATRENEKQVLAFITALEKLGIASGSIGVKNFVVEANVVGRGYSVSQNLVITQTDVNRRPAQELARLMAQIQDVGARFGSSCVTCIGSG